MQCYVYYLSTITMYIIQVHVSIQMIPFPELSIVSSRSQITENYCVL